MSGVLHLNNAIIGKWFKTGTGFKLPHGSDPTQEPIPKGYVFIKADQSKKEGRIAPIFRYMWDKTKNYWVTNEYSERKIKFITAEGFRKLSNVSVTDLYALGDKDGNPISLGASPSLVNCSLGLILGHDGTVMFDDQDEAESKMVEKLDDDLVPTEIIKQMEIADGHPMDSILAKVTKVDPSGGGYWPCNYSIDGAKVIYKGAPGVALSYNPPTYPSTALGQPLFLPSVDGNWLSLQPMLVKLFVWASGYPEWIAKLIVNADPQKVYHDLNNKFKPGTCWNLTVPDPFLAIISGSPSGNPASWSHPCILDYVDWATGEIHFFVMTGATEEGKPKPNMVPYMEGWLPVHHKVVNGEAIKIPYDPLDRKQTVEIIYDESKANRQKVPKGKSSYVCLFQARFRFADISNLSPMGSFEVEEKSLNQLRGWSKHEEDKVPFVKKNKQGLSETALENLRASGYNI